ncbi:peptidase [Chryseobacterium sp. SC28]|uniref:peptidase n=1 Tax=Chryseobacterium sp. SC28 TaxID=2268028 RepID=UPI000F6454E3|nr:peptidase [Chryseobacterium sp. SC28]RRQ45808.1 peptidase [Chryseobacterium sp. SC28]
MANQLWKVTAKRDSFNIKKGMNVEILIKNASRKPNQKEVVEAINEKYGDKTATNGTSLSIFEIEELN